ncbi:hypothetical protein Dda_2275 [Drechslerella dactyloides]|uniref:Uncharacterized protein n=1 Tax=Drechslerella dactyloides TaxID=74499 RepID=A0AAD6J439_DREDA|nr:hypothetical protein Dda_2275 [Drechslerella dactyloides]
MASGDDYGRTGTPAFARLRRQVGNVFRKSLSREHAPGCQSSLRRPGQRYAIGNRELANLKYGEKPADKEKALSTLGWHDLEPKMKYESLAGEEEQKAVVVKIDEDEDVEEETDADKGVFWVITM